MEQEPDGAARTGHGEKGWVNMALHELGKLKIGFQDGGLEFGWGDKALRRLNPPRMITTIIRKAARA